MFYRNNDDNGIKFSWKRIILILVKEGNCVQIPMILCGVRTLNKQLIYWFNQKW